MSTSPVVDETCNAFNSARNDLDPSILHRFVVGDPEGPRALSPDEIAAELGDPFASLLLAAGRFPKTADELLATIDEVTPDDDPLRKQMSFLLGEGSQLPGGPDAPGTNRGMRFLVTRGSAPDIDLLISASFPDSGLVEVMAWDRRAGGFNYYRNAVGERGAWAFAGNARDALDPPTKGKGPFESHPTGSLLMKELKFPWLHWHSPAVNIFPEAFDTGDRRVAHRWFQEKLGADVAELSVAIPSIDRWTAVRFDAAILAGGAVADPRRIVEQVVTTPTVNLTTSNTASGAVTTGDAVDLPATFFLDVDALCGPQLDLEPPPPFAVSGEHYLAALAQFRSALVDRGSGFRHPADEDQFADTHFAFAVPERAFEDQATLREAIARGLLTPRLAAALLMVDFPNPVFSARRTALFAHAPADAPDASAYSARYADAVLAAADAAGDGSPEREFADLWGAGESFVAAFNQRLMPYYEALTARLATREGYFGIVRLAESRRQGVRTLPIGSEFDLLFATLRDDAAPRPLRMTPTATIEEA
ncbi:MAG: hypothetical protein ACR2IN_04995 [Thermoleophilaceae bacterium]